MPNDYAKLLAKLDRPPAGPNWVRFIRSDVNSTAKAIISFAKGTPLFTYQPSYTAVRDRIQFGIGRETALQMVRRSGAPAGRVQNEKLVEAFYDFDEQRAYSAQNLVEFERGLFMVSREVRVPVAPLCVLFENASFVPVFLCGWNSIPLTLVQRRLLVTIYEDAFLSLTDYQSAPAEFLFFPEMERNGVKRREAEVWHRGDYETLSAAELGECVEIFIHARDQARQILIDEWAAVLRRQSDVSGSSTSVEIKDLFSRKE